MTRAATGLTARETEVLELVSARLSNGEIAERLVVSVRTVETHVSALLRKLGAPDRRALARLAGPAPPVARPDRPALPVPLTPFVGRHGELAGLVAAVAGHRLVTATGPGGVGKTRLALAAAHRAAAGHRAGAVFVDLVKVVDPAMVTAAVADAAGVPERAGADRGATLLAALADQDLLLVIDNCEHLVDGVRPCVEQLLTACPAVRILATSRIRLMLPFETVVAVPGLSADDDGPALFLARMAAAGATETVTPDQRATVRAICQALDGMALAIELAAARVPGLGLDGLSRALAAHLPLLDVGRRAQDRHRSLRAAIDWSHALLDADERAALQAAAVFAGRFDAEALAVVQGRPPGAALHAVGRLVDWNLVMPVRGATTRYRVLESIRQYAAELADAHGTGDRLRAAHLAWVRSGLAGLLDRTGDTEPGRWCAEVDALLDDAHAALAWAGAHPDRRAAAADLAGLLAAAAFHRGRPGEARHRYTQAAGWADDDADRHRALSLAAGAAAAHNDGAEAIDLLEQSARATADPDRAAVDLAWAAIYRLRNAGIIAGPVPDGDATATLDRARRLSRGGRRAAAAVAIAEGWAPRVTIRSRAHTGHALAMARAADDPLLLNVALDQLVVVELTDRDLAAALTAIRDRLAVLAPLRVDARTGFELYDAFHMACHLFLATGDLVTARRYADAVAALPFLREARHVGLGRRVEVDALAGAFATVVADGERIERDWVRAGRPAAGNLAAMGTHAVAAVHRMLGDADRHRHWTGITEAVLGMPLTAVGRDIGWVRVFEALADLHADDPRAAADRLVAEPEHAVWADPNTMFWLPWHAALWAEAAVLTGHPEAAERLPRAAHAARANPVAAAVVERAAALLAGDRTALAGFATRFADAGCPYQAARTERLVRATVRPTAR